jgi:tripartite-type tricarboxylate transporter receptor subunit TctC
MVWRAVWVAVAISSGGGAARADPFAGGKVTIAINSPSGGGYDAYARLVARHLGKYLDGNPAMIPTNMPGAGGLIAANWLYNAAPKDGSAIGIIASSAIFAAFLGGKQARYDAGRFNWLMSLDDYHGVGIALTSAPVKNAQDLLSKQLIAGAAGEGSDVTIWPNLIKSIVGAKLDIVRGYSGTPTIFLAMERGEVQSVFGLGWASVKAQKADWLTSKKVRPIVQISAERAPDLPEVPTVLDLVKNPEDRAVLELFIARQIYFRPFVAPPDLPAGAMAALRDAFAKMSQDPDFLRDAAQSGMDINVTPGSEMKQTIDKVLASPRPIVDRATAELNAAL